MPCYLTFSAKDFDPNALVATLQKAPDKIFRAGERNGRQKNSGFSYSTSEADFDDLDQQIADTTLFLRTHEADLRRVGELRSSLAGSWYRVDFGFETRMFDDDVAVQIDSFPAELLLLLGNIGADLMISQYPPATDKEESEES